MPEWIVTKRLVGAALELPPAEREAYVCSQAPDSATRDAVLALVRASEAAGDFLLDPTIAVPDAAVLEPPVPAAIGRYPVEARLGRGGTGTVYRARDPKLDRSVAIKVLHARGPEPEVLVREARTLARCAHANIATLFSLDEMEDGRRFLVMELAEGTDLADRLRAGPLSLGEALFVAHQVGAALRAAHAHGIVHRDLKPRNVRLDEDGAVKVLDFGIARRSSGTRAVAPTPQPEEASGLPARGEESTLAPHREERQLDSVVSDLAGTPGYMSPEQRRGAPVDARSDLYAFGALLFECLTGRRAQAQDGVDWSALRDDTPASLRALLERCLADDPETRPESADVILIELESIARDLGVKLRSAGAPLLDSRGHRRRHAPTPLTRFIGRAHELAELERKLSEHRFVTITGSGGSGKSRLALELAERSWSGFADGVHWIALEATTSPDEVERAALAALGEAEHPGKTTAQKLLDTLSSREMLLVLDGCEHVQTAAARLAEDILDHCARVKVLATSLQRLGLADEVTFAVPPLSFPPEGADRAEIERAESVHLFVERAREAQRAFALDDGNARDVAALCRQLDGIPLAIELAAARARAMTPAQLLDRLSRSLAVLGIPHGGAVPRQRTMRAVYDWGFDLLSPEERSVLPMLSVFTGGATLEAVEAVSANDRAFEVVSALVEKSQLFFTHDGGERRYHLLQTARLYAAEKLDRSGILPTVRERHAQYYLALAERGERATEEKRWLDALEADHPNIVAALQFAISQSRAELALRLVNAVSGFWNLRGYSSLARTLLAQAVGVPGSERHPRLKARALEWSGHMDAIQGDLSAAGLHYEEARALYEQHHDPGLPGALCSLGNLALHRYDHAEARRLLEESRRSSQAAGQESGVARCLALLAILTRREGDMSRAEELDVEALVIFRRLGEKRGIGSTLNGLANSAVHRGDLPRARALYEECLAIARELGLKTSIPATLNNLAFVATLSGDHAQALALYSEALQLARRTGDPRNLSLAFASKAKSLMQLARLEEARTCLLDCFELLSERGSGGDLVHALEASAILAARLGDDRIAAELCGAAATVRDPTGEVLPGSDPLEGTAALDPVRAREPAAFERNWAAGRALTGAEAIERARVFLSRENS